ncbi:ABC transporter ATP-binding protein [Marinomonas agarivorans]|nr:ABC transporter ATP-binding protein [Marinomonas agarivorans]
MNYSIEASLRYHSSLPHIYQEMQFFVPEGKITCILGESGCGKSSLLKQIAGIVERANVNHLRVVNDKGREISANNLISYMGQSDLLMPWLSVLDNVLLSFDLKRPFFSKKSHNNSALHEQALYLLKELGVGDIANKHPDQLSGGTRQRVALARTLIQNKPIVLMDEPFSALDAVTRYSLQNLAAAKLKNKTVLLITHDPQEALRLGENVLVFSKKGKNTPLLTRFDLPNSSIPRGINSDFGKWEEKLLKKLGVIR